MYVGPVARGQSHLLVVRMRPPLSHIPSDRHYSLIIPRCRDAQYQERDSKYRTTLYTRYFVININKLRSYALASSPAS